MMCKIKAVVHGIHMEAQVDSNIKAYEVVEGITGEWPEAFALAAGTVSEALEQAYGTRHVVADALLHDRSLHIVRHDAELWVEVLA